ncbi:MAG: bifunctional (p)ppGpp synthetase/guanosine-3',5'-bis(diphosphate) 3'-pyrophosphohydrolase [Candidatus Gastranaerophilales bacterium]|nr:bifunctional (p)ppGpp synthetase/guanosine-3',5'-bis(diphosphate) 3'-pyrophosphohydrolase [Candidatus Gastranaerophilales bacterium]
MTYQKTFDEIKESLHKQKRHANDIEQIEKAFQWAKMLHEGQYRISQEPYIIHPLEVAKILVDLKLDKNTIIAAFLHDILEDTQTTSEEMKEKFGEDVLNLVQGVTKLNKYQFKSKEERQAENFRRMLIAMAQDIRIVVLKLADRLHNMRTLSFMAANKQKKIAQETMDIFAPLANRLGMGKIKAELEDLSLRYLYPEKYYEIAKLVAETKSMRDATVNALIDIITKELEKNKIKAQIKGRAKHYYSIYNKMKRLNVTFDQLYDVTAVRVIVDNETECYQVLGIIHQLFKPIPGRFKDYIAMPKGNMYRSLHTSVIGAKNKPVEIQIRTHKMHEVAEYGVAAHWRYKESGSIKATSGQDVQFSWMRKVMELDKESTDTKDFVESVKLDLFNDQVFAFTPNGDVFDLPQNSTPVDFAYRIHTEVGHKTVGALINGRIAQLDTKLKNGDIVEILTSKQYMPKIDWLNFVVTKNASSKIRQWFKKFNREDNIQIGKTNLEIELTKAVFEELTKGGFIDKAAKEMNYKSSNDLFAALGYGETTVHKVLNTLKKYEPPKTDEELAKAQNQNTSKKAKSKKNDIIGLEGLLWSLAKCCSPIPGEPIIGVVTRSKGVSVHRLDCKCLYNIEPERMMDISWADGTTKTSYVAHIRIECQDRVGLLRDVLIKTGDLGTNIIYSNTYLKGRKFGIIDLGLELDNVETLKKVILSIQAIPDICSVRRLQQKENLNQPKPNKKKNKKTPQKDSK